MDFKTLWSRYRSGTAGGEEISQVEAELEKFRLLEAYIEEERPPLPPPDTQRLQEELRRKQLKPHFLAPFQSGTPLRESLRAYVREQGEKLEKFRKR